MSAPPFTAALVQMRSGADLDRNAQDLRERVAEAAGLGATYVQTPEMTGAVARGSELLAAARDMEDDPVVRAASEASAAHGVWLHVGSTPLLSSEPGRLANRALLFAPDGTLRAWYDKLHMFDVDLPDGETWRESKLYRPGNRTVVVDMDGTRIGLGICYDLRFPTLFAAQARAGASVLPAPAAFTAQTGRAHWHVLARARAIECGAVLLAAAQGGTHEDGRRTYGHSIAVSPWGEVIGELDHDEPGVLSVLVDRKRSADARARIANLRHGREFTLDVIEDGTVREAAE